MAEQKESEISERTIVHNPRIDAVLDEISPRDKVLDIGCVQHTAEKEGSEDHWLHGELCEISDSVLGLDYLEEEVEKLNERGYTAVCANAESFELNEKFDIITAGELIEHLSNPGEFVDRIRTHLRDNGKFILTTPNPWYIRRFFEALILGDVHANSEHTCWFDRRTLHQVLERHGFNVQMFQYTKAPYFKRNLSLENIDAVLTRAIRQIGFNTLTGHSIVVIAEKL